MFASLFQAAWVRVFAVTQLLYAMTLAATPATELRKTPDGWQLLRDGQPYVIKGVGGSGSKQLLKQAGGNSFRTWDAEKIDKELEEAQQLGLTVAVGIWLKHERHGFDYSDVNFCADQLARVEKLVKQHKDHPAVLLWALGNEMEGEHGKNAAVWSHIESCAAMVKRIDPTRPTMTVIAEIGSEKVTNIHRLCPSIDIIGINTYAGASSVIERYRKQGGTKPVVITEFGPFGTWESPRNEFDSLLELTSTQKAEQYRKHYKTTAIDNKELVLGGYAFTWGSKLEMTNTWFGMLLRDGSKLAAVDTMTELWTGQPPANKCPAIEPIVISTPAKMSPGQSFEASVVSKDPEGDTLSYEWALWNEVAKPGLGGDPEEHPPVYPDAVKVLEPGRVAVTMPNETGRFRLYVYVRDNKGSAATANVPLVTAAASDNK
jgi:hypothetical protein